MKTAPINEVEKTWGKEIWVCNNPKYCGKVLILNKGNRCSFHFHRKKDETFYVLDGQVLMEWDYNTPKKVTLSIGDVFHIPPFMSHRFTGLDDSRIIEFSTFHDDSDTVRLELGGKINES